MTVRAAAGPSGHPHATDLDALALDDGPVRGRVAGAGVDRLQLGQIEGEVTVTGLDGAFRLGVLGHIMSSHCASDSLRELLGKLERVVRLGVEVHAMDYGGLQVIAGQ